MNRARVGFVVALMMGAGASMAPVLAQEAPPLADDPLFATLFQPDLIMQHRRDIALTNAQRDAISELIQNLQGRVIRLQWQLLDEIQTLTGTTSGTRVDLDKALDQMGDVLGTENEIKQAHLEMLVRVKNLLSADQQAILERLRNGGA